MNENLELHFEDDKAIFVNDENRVELDFADAKTIMLWSADFSFPFNRREPQSEIANITGVLVHHDDRAVLIDEPQANGFKALMLVQGENQINLTPKEVIAVSGAIANKVLDR